jgi:hypothetical protein
MKIKVMVKCQIEWLNQYLNKMDFGYKQYKIRIVKVE